MGSHRYGDIRDDYADCLKHGIWHNSKLRDKLHWFFGYQPIAILDSCGYFVKIDYYFGIHSLLSKWWILKHRWRIFHKKPFKFSGYARYGCYLLAEYEQGQVYYRIGYLLSGGDDIDLPQPIVAASLDLWNQDA